MPASQAGPLAASGSREDRGLITGVLAGHLHGRREQQCPDAWAGQCWALQVGSPSRRSGSMKAAGMERRQARKGRRWRGRDGGCQVICIFLMA